jgi:NhaA family Na+:H+ antiporter
MIAAAVALIWANSPFASSYTALWQTPLTVGLGDLALSKPLILWINDGLMAIFFLVVGLEIKREILVGELREPRKALLPVVAAVGGAALPALIFVILVAGSRPEAIRGWGIPMATDIAFALGVLALLGRRAPIALRVFLTALAIVDDLLAVLVIALFYTSNVAVMALVAAGVTLGLLIAANRLGVRRPVVYALLGFVLWAGVLLALTIPATTRLDAAAFAAAARERLDDFEREDDGESGVTATQHAALWDLEEATEQAQAPMMRMEHGLHQWVAFFIVPLFALANAGVALTGDLGAMLTDPIVVGVVLGLVVGKQVGITAATWLLVRSGRASLPEGVRWHHIYGVAWLGGIGFTMSLFIGELAFHDSPALPLAKIGILLASVIAGIGGYLILRAAGTEEPPEERHVHEA